MFNLFGITYNVFKWEGKPNLVCHAILLLNPLSVFRIMWLYGHWQTSKDLPGSIDQFILAHWICFFVVVALWKLSSFERMVKVWTQLSTYRYSMFMHSMQLVNTFKVLPCIFPNKPKKNDKHILDTFKMEMERTRAMNKYSWFKLCRNDKHEMCIWSIRPISTIRFSAR